MAWSESKAGEPGLLAAALVVKLDSRPREATETRLEDASSETTNEGTSRKLLQAPLSSMGVDASATPPLLPSTA